MTGDVVVAAASERETNKVCLHLNHLLPGDRIVLISDKGAVQEWIADSHTCDFSAASDGHLFVRAEVWRPGEQHNNRLLLAAVTNPIYFDTE